MGKARQARAAVVSDAYDDLLAAIERLRPDPNAPDHIVCGDALTPHALAWQMRATIGRAAENPYDTTGMKIRVDPALGPGVVEMRTRDGRTLWQTTLPPSP